MEQVELPEEVELAIGELSGEGDALAEDGDYHRAVATYVRALEMLPEPRNDWEASTWLLVAIGDANFLAQQYAHALAALADAMHCPDAIGNPFIHMRLGQCMYEMGDLKQAGEELCRAYMSAGTKIFDNDDPKYLAYVKTVLSPPAADGQW